MSQFPVQQLDPNTPQAMQAFSEASATQKLLAQIEAEKELQTARVAAQEKLQKAEIEAQAEQYGLLREHQAQMGQQEQAGANQRQQQQQEFAAQQQAADQQFQLEREKRDREAQETAFAYMQDLDAKIKEFEAAKLRIHGKASAELRTKIEDLRKQRATLEGSIGAVQALIDPETGTLRQNAMQMRDKMLKGIGVEIGPDGVAEPIPGGLVDKLMADRVDGVRVAERAINRTLREFATDPKVAARLLLGSPKQQFEERYGKLAARMIPGTLAATEFVRKQFDEDFKSYDPSVVERGDGATGELFEMVAEKVGDELESLPGHTEVQSGAVKDHLKGLMYSLLRLANAEADSGSPAQEAERQLYTQMARNRVEKLQEAGLQTHQIAAIVQHTAKIGDEYRDASYSKMFEVEYEVDEKTGEVKGVAKKGEIATNELKANEKTHLRNVFNAVSKLDNGWTSLGVKEPTYEGLFSAARAIHTLTERFGSSADLQQGLEGLVDQGTMQKLVDTYKTGGGDTFKGQYEEGKGKLRGMESERGGLDLELGMLGDAYSQLGPPEAAEEEATALEELAGYQRNKSKKGLGRRGAR